MSKNFPQFRKLSNNKSFFKIESDKLFTEYQKIGEKFITHQVEANQYPEMVKIQDMLACTSPFDVWDKEKEYSELVSQ